MVLPNGLNLSDERTTKYVLDGVIRMSGKDKLVVYSTELMY